jgi:hypothetical protein
MRALRAFEEDVLSPLNRLTEQDGRVGNVVLQPIGIGHILLKDFLQLNFVDPIEPLKKPIDLDEILFQLLAEQGWIEQVADANPNARHLIRI